LRDEAPAGYPVRESCLVQVLEQVVREHDPWVLSIVGAARINREVLALKVAAIGA
jgi:hypothetical protein